MKINTTELRMHLSDYLKMVNNEDIIITNKGREVARIISPIQSKKRKLNELIGILPTISDEEINDIKQKRLENL